MLTKLPCREIPSAGAAMTLLGWGIVLPTYRIIRWQRRSPPPNVSNVFTDVHIQGY